MPQYTFPVNSREQKHVDRDNLYGVNAHVHLLPLFAYYCGLLKKVEHINKVEFTSSGISLQHGSMVLLSLVLIKFYMYKTTKTPSPMIYN